MPPGFTDAYTKLIDGGWQRLSATGEKIFISGGDQDMSNDISHLVLALTGKRGLHSHGGSAATTFDSLIGEISNDKDVISLRDKWLELSAQVKAAKNPSTHAYEFAQMGGQLYFKAVLSKMEAMEESPMI